MKVNDRDGVTRKHNGWREERKSYLLANANFIEHQLRKVFYDAFWGKQNRRDVPLPPNLPPLALMAPGGVAPRASERAPIPPSQPGRY